MKQMQSQIYASPSFAQELEVVKKTICNRSRDWIIASKRQELLFNIVKPSQFGLQIQEDRARQSGILETIPRLRTSKAKTSSSYANLPVLPITPCETTRTYVGRHILSSETISTQNSTTIHRETPDSGLLIRLLIPISITLVLMILVIVFCLHRRKKRRRKRARKWTRNNDTTLSWFEAFELPHAVGTLNTMNELNEPADFSIPMGPLCMNNFAFENYDATLVDSIMERYSTKRNLSRDFHHKEKRRRSDVYPARHIYNQMFDLESDTKASNLPALQHVNPAAEIELSSTAKTTDTYKMVKNNFYGYHAKNDD